MEYKYWICRAFNFKPFEPKKLYPISDQHFITNTMSITLSFMIIVTWRWWHTINQFVVYSCFQQLFQWHWPAYNLVTMQQLNLVINGQPQFGLYYGNNILLSYSVTIKCSQQQIPEESVLMSLEFREQMSLTHWHLLAESSDVKNGNLS